jgi:ACS family glucarate transporter-like MFS transporter
MSGQRARTEGAVSTASSGAVGSVALIDTTIARKARRVQAWVVVLMLGFSVMSYFDRTIMSITGPGIIREFRLSETQMGSVYSALILSYAVLMIPGGHFADRFGPWRILTLMGLGAALFTGLTAVAGRPGLGSYLGVVTSFFVIRLALGAATAPLYPSCARVAAHWVPPQQRAGVWALVVAGAGIGSALTPILCSWMIASFGWRNTFWMAGAATAALAVCWGWYARDDPAQHPALRNVDYGSVFSWRPATRELRHRTSWRKLLKNVDLILLTFAYGATGYFEYIFFYWIYYYFQKIRHLDVKQSAVYTMAIFVSLSLGALLLYGATLLTRPPATVALLCLAFGFCSMSEGPFWAALIDVAGGDVGAAGGILNTGSNVGGFVAPILTPFIASFVGWAWALFFGCCVLATGVLVWFFIDPQPKITLGEPLPAKVKT